MIHRLNALLQLLLSGEYNATLDWESGERLLNFEQETVNQGVDIPDIQNYNHVIEKVKKIEEPTTSTENDQSQPRLSESKNTLVEQGVDIPDTQSHNHVDQADKQATDYVDLGKLKANNGGLQLGVLWNTLSSVGGSSSNKIL